MNEPRDIFQVCVDAATAAGLEFLLIVGHAVNARGYLRTTLDYDFLLAARDLRPWSEILAAAGYALIVPERPIAAFAQFQPREGEGFRVDLMLVDDATFAKLLAGSEWLDYGHRSVRVIGVLHLIALKLHALREAQRELLGKDYLDILTLIRRNGIDPGSAEFQETLHRHGTDSIRQRLQHDLG